MENELLNKIVKILDEKKAIDVKTIDIKEKSSLADYMVVASGTSITHIKALADNVEEELKNGSLKEIKIQNLQLHHDTTFLWNKNSVYSKQYNEICKELIGGFN